MYLPLARSPSADDGGAIRTVTRPSASGPSATRVDVVGDQPRVAGQDAVERRVDRPEQGVDRAVALGRAVPLVVAGADDDGARGSGRSSRTRPSSARDGGSGWRWLVIGLPPRARVDDRAARGRAVVKWRSSRRRSSAPAFQIAYSSESARAAAEAAMMFVSLPIVDQVRAPSAESMTTRVRAAVAAPPSRIRTL